MGKNFHFNFKYFNWFYQYLNHRIFLISFFALVLGFCDGFGISMFLPLLQVSTESNYNKSSLGKLQIIIDSLDNFGFDVTTTSILFLLFLFFLLKAIFKYYGEFYRVISQQYLLSQTRKILIDLLQNINYEFFTSSNLGRVQNTMTEEINRLQQAFIFYFQTIEQLLLVTVYMGFTFLIDFQFAALITFGSLFTNIVYKNIYKKTKNLSMNFSEETNTFHSQINQFVYNFKYLKSTGTFDVFSKIIYRTIFKIELTRRKIGATSALIIAIREPILLLVVISIIAIQTKLLGSPLTPILISLLFFYRALSSLSSMQNNWNKFLGISGSIDNIISFKKDLEKSVKINYGKDYEGLRDEIILKDLNIEVSGNKILNSINLKIKKNHSLAIIGESGSGKTTLVNSIAGLFIPNNGKVLIDGINLLEYDIKKYQKRIGYVTQEPTIFNDTIFNNVTLWAERTDSNIIRFNKIVAESRLSEFVDKLPLKENTVIGNNGMDLSGGQRQRISIARELFKEIDILIMDEATSSLDSITEQFIKKSINNLKGRYTMIIVAHRFSTIKNADEIIILKNGTISNRGNFKDLKINSKEFREIDKIQNN